MGAGVVPQAYICCAIVQQAVKVFCLHLPSKFVSALDGRVTPWDGEGFAFLGEVTQSTATSVNFPSNAFRAFRNTKAKSSDYTATHLDEIGEKGFSPAQVQDPDTSIVNTRQVMYLPCVMQPSC
jgi:hypothetical protein